MKRAHETSSKANKRARFVWSEELHEAFVSSIFDIGVAHMTSRALFDIARSNHRQFSESRIREFVEQLIAFRFHSKMLGVNDIQALTVIPTAKLNSMQSMSCDPISKAAKVKMPGSRSSPRKSSVLALPGLSELMLQQFSSSSKFLHKEFPRLKDSSTPSPVGDYPGTNTATTPPTTIGSDISLEEQTRPYSPFECEVDSYFDVPVNVDDDCFMKLFLD